MARETFQCGRTIRPRHGSGLIGDPVSRGIASVSGLRLPSKNAVSFAIAFENSRSRSSSIAIGHVRRSRTRRGSSRIRATAFDHVARK